MNNRLLLALAVATTGLAGTALAADEPGSWYLSPLLQYTGLDSGRQAKDDLGGQLGLGYNLTPDWALEGAFGYGGFDRNAGGSIRLQTYTLDALRKFTLDSSAVQPYLLFGAGALRERVTPVTDTQTNLGAEVGAGLLYGIGNQTGATRFALRAEAKYRLDFVNNPAYTNSRPGDLIAGLLRRRLPRRRLRRRRLRRLRRRHLPRRRRPRRLRSTWRACISRPTRP